MNAQRAAQSSAIVRRGVPLTGLLAAETLSLLGNQVAAVAVPLAVLQVTGSAAKAGIAGSANLWPVLFAAVIGGRAIDRWGAWRASVIADCASALSVLLLPIALIYLDGVTAGTLFALVLVGALFDPTGVAARQTLVPRFARLARRPLSAVNSLRGVLENGADAAGPLVGAALVGWLGATHALFVNALSFAACVALFVAAVPRPRRAVRVDVVMPLAGFRFVASNRVLRALAVTGLIANGLLLPYLALLLPVLASQTLRAPALFGVAVAAFGLGATVSAGAFAWLARRLPRSLIYYGGLLLGAVGIALCGAAPLPGVIVTGALLTGSALGAGNPLEQTVLQEVAPQADAGRIFTALAALRFAAAPVTIVVAGFATQHYGAPALLLGSGAVLAVTALAGWIAAPLPESQ